MSVKEGILRVFEVSQWQNKSFWTSGTQPYRQAIVCWVTLARCLQFRCGEETEPLMSKFIISFDKVLSGSLKRDVREDFCCFFCSKPKNINWNNEIRILREGKTTDFRSSPKTASACNSLKIWFTNTVYERYLFFSRGQESGESIDKSRLQF